MTKEQPAAVDALAYMRELRSEQEELRGRIPGLKEDRARLAEQRIFGGVTDREIDAKVDELRRCEDRIALIENELLPPAIRLYEEQERARAVQARVAALEMQASRFAKAVETRIDVFLGCLAAEVRTAYESLDWSDLRPTLTKEQRRAVDSAFQDLRGGLLTFVKARMRAFEMLTAPGEQPESGTASEMSVSEWIAHSTEKALANVRRVVAKTDSPHHAEPRVAVDPGSKAAELEAVGQGRADVPSEPKVRPADGFWLIGRLGEGPLAPPSRKRPSSADVTAVTSEEPEPAA